MLKKHRLMISTARARETVRRVALVAQVLQTVVTRMLLFLVRFPQLILKLVNLLLSRM